ncbi:MAG: hypothetical protein US62_C0014G0011 [Candidatus Woesebacteria bacterium GW2011_GWA1_37_8]|uniref:Uncharacterized protein n=2 Tax=Candidatus Woeseibacteriota TaxID=1752722 RepID=A0A0G0L4W3_9BACT|nr:MAG: hypothetical protein US39_C0016G0013 [Microgenomates group bacterium GW2011_GWC1_37_12b]KKQ45507.1 MAG: hypothetical protein US62_C0014G0011 [Candidatus Woesebacteria bacterium GW2011_GWA1_37_8]KKQ87033.1 MAG: hypothetical protein UT10_C0012G0021 [Candidatus Woesebacteria bacterium GW2011_GWB1_38_8b]
MTALKKGFTLIELLIVIAILGVLAVVVLVAINPAQQLARTRDAGRISSVAQIGHALEAFATVHAGAYPTTVEWNADVLVTSGELNNLPGLVQNTLTSTCTTQAIDGWCYSVAASPAGFAVYSRLEADTNLTLGGGTCNGTNPAFVVYSSANGRACIICQAGEPTAGAPGTCAN